MGEIRYGIAGSPITHSLSPLLMALTCDHLGLINRNRVLKIELVNGTIISDALAWGYAGSVPNPLEWDLTQAVFGKFRTTALLEKAITAAREVKIPASSLGAKGYVSPLPKRLSNSSKLPTRMFDDEIWMNLTHPLKHQLDSEAVVSIDGSREIKSINALRWDGKGWWSAGLDGSGVCDVMTHHGHPPEGTVLGLIGGGGAARSTAKAWTEQGGAIRILGGRRELGDGPWSEFLTEQAPGVIVNFDGGQTPSDGNLTLQAAYERMDGTLEERIGKMASTPLDGRWLLVAQHLACWAQLWAPERIDDLPSLDLLVNRLIVAETTLHQYA